MIPVRASEVVLGNGGMNFQTFSRSNMRHQFLVYDRFTEHQWHRMSYEEQHRAAERWFSEYSDNAKYWPTTVGE